MTEREVNVHTSETRELMRRGSEPILRPPCPNCGRPMHLSYSNSAYGVLPDVRRYRCGECGVSVTGAADD